MLTAIVLKLKAKKKKKEFDQLQNVLNIQGKNDSRDIMLIHFKNVILGGLFPSGAGGVQPDWWLFRAHLVFGAS